MHSNLIMQNLSDKEGVDLLVKKYQELKNEIQKKIGESTQ